MASKSIRFKFISYVSFLIIVFSFIFLAIFLSRSNKFIETSLIDFGFHLVDDLSFSSGLSVSAEDPVLLLPSFDNVFIEKNVVLVSVYNKRGNLFVLKKKIEIEERISQEILQRLKAEKTSLMQKSSSGKDIYDFYAPILATEFLTEGSAVEDEVIGFARVSLTFDVLKEEMASMLFNGFLISILAILVGGGISFLFTNKLTRPLQLLIRGVNTIAKGNLDYQIEIKTGDEVEDLAKSFNKMAQSLKVSRDKLEESKTNLEIRVAAKTKELRILTEGLDKEVKERTKELEEKVKELEKFQQITVGRELKMIELKEEIKKLKLKTGRENAK